MPKLIMIAREGVLTGETTSEATSNDDLILSEGDNQQRQIIKNGVTMVAQLNELVQKHDYVLALHCDDPINEQLATLAMLQAACQKIEIEFPTIPVLIVMNHDGSAGVSSDNPDIYQQDETTILSYGIQKNKKCAVREALTNYFVIDASEYNQQVIFDNKIEIANQASEDGFWAFYLNQELDLADAIDQFHQQATAQHHAPLPVDIDPLAVDIIEDKANAKWKIPEGLDGYNESDNEKIATHYVEQIIPDIKTPEQLLNLLESIGVGIGDKWGSNPDLSTLRLRRDNLYFRKKYSYRETNDSERIAEACKKRAKELIALNREQNDGVLLLTNETKAIYEKIFKVQHKRFPTTMKSFWYSIDGDNTNWFEEQFKANPDKPNNGYAMV